MRAAPDAAQSAMVHRLSVMPERMMPPWADRCPKAYEVYRKVYAETNQAHALMTRIIAVAVACAAFFGACVCAYAIDPQFVQPVPATPPVFNPSYPYTVAQPPYTPISPTTPSVFSGSDVPVPLTRSHRPLTRSHRRTATPPSKVAKVGTQEIPTLPVEQLCRATSAQNLIPLAAEGDAKAAFDNCMQSERRYREELTKDWANFSQADKQHCVSLVQMGGSASYAELITCLEMAREVRQSKDSSANPQRKR